MRNKNKMLISVVIGIIILIIFLYPKAKSLFLTWRPVKIINHHSFDLAIDDEAYIQLGCTENKFGIDCSNSEIKNLKEFSDCSKITKPNNLGGLISDELIFECSYSYENNNDQTRIWSDGCSSFTFNKYFIQENNKYIRLENEEDFKNYFAPIDTSEKALSYATALRESSPIFEFEELDNYHKFVSTIETTHVKESEDGYLLNLFETQRCGCLPQPYYEIEYFVSKNGNISEISKSKIYEDPIKTVCIN